MSLIRKIYNKANALVKKTHWYRDVMFQDCEKFWKYKTFNTDVVNLGSTTSVCAFDYSDLPVKGANWALSHNPLFGDQAILKNYESFLNPQKSYCLISLCTFTSLAGSYDYMEDRYYTILYPSSISNFSYTRQRQIDNIRNRPLFYYPLYSLAQDVVRLFKRNKVKSLSEDEMGKDAVRWMNGWLSEFSIDNIEEPLSLKNQDGIEDAAIILNDIIVFCKERNIVPIMVIPPMYHTLSEKFTPELRSTLIDSLLSKIEDKSIPFLNYMDDADYSNNLSLFRNSLCLNKKGAKHFTRRVLTDIGVIGNSGNA